MCKRSHKLSATLTALTDLPCLLLQSAHPSVYILLCVNITVRRIASKTVWWLYTCVWHNQTAFSILENTEQQYVQCTLYTACTYNHSSCVCFIFCVFEYSQHLRSQHTAVCLNTHNTCNTIYNTNTITAQSCVFQLLRARVLFCPVYLQPSLSTHLTH